MGNNTANHKKFGTFGGVFTPCTLTILGVIMFLRFGVVIGNAGIFHGILIVLMAKVITTLTTMSLSAIATNTMVKGGGAYFLISRSLGVEFGGAIGIVFFLSQAISVALYVMGFTETLAAVSSTVSDNYLLTASIVNAVVFLCVYIGAAWTIKVQYFILAILAAAIASFVIGGIGKFDINIMQDNMSSDYTPGNNLWTMFALFFPAATGVMAGANMSGDLANPGRAIPRGTFSSIFVTAIVYLVFAVILGCACPREALLHNAMIVSETALSSKLIVAGIFAATISSALGSMMGAPRILQALAKDRIFGVLNLFIHGSNKSGEPRRAIIMTFLIAEFGILLGNLDMIAPVITMFFMITYGVLNFAAFKEYVSGNPSYRPTFKIRHWSISLAGAILCLMVMTLIDPLWAVVSIVIMAAIYYYLAKREIESNWGNLNSGSAIERVRRDLLRLELEKYHPKNWRPTILAFEMHRDEDLAAAVMARNLAGRNGLLILGQVITTDNDAVLDRHTRVHRMLRKKIAENQLDAFPAVTIADTTEDGISSLVQCCGIGAVRPNLIMFNWPADEVETKEITNSIRNVNSLGRSVAILKIKDQPHDPWYVPRGTIDVWWLGQSNGTLMILIAHLLRNNNLWRDHKIRLIRTIKDPAGIATTRQYLNELAASARIDVKPTVFVSDNFMQCLQTESARSSLCILGLANPAEMPDDIFDRLTEMTGDLPRVLFVNSFGDMSIEA